MNVRLLSSQTSIQFIKYFLLSGAAFICDAGLLFFFTEYFALHYLVSATISFLAGLMIVYIGSVRWVFEERSFESKYTEFFLFASVGLVGLALNDLILWIFTGTFAFYYMASKVIAAGTVFVWNFFARKFLIFNARTWLKKQSL
jgi:putative flippase GtrA